MQLPGQKVEWSQSRGTIHLVSERRPSPTAGAVRLSTGAHRLFIYSEFGFPRSFSGVEFDTRLPVTTSAFRKNNTTTGSFPGGKHNSTISRCWQTYHECVRTSIGKSMYERVEVLCRPSGPNLGYCRRARIERSGFTGATSVSCHCAKTTCPTTEIEGH